LPEWRKLPLLSTMAYDVPDIAKFDRRNFQGNFRQQHERRLNEQEQSPAEVWKK